MDHHTIRRIFIIDDSKYITRQLTNVLTKAGYEVVAENHVREGLQKLFRADFDLMIVDLEMPEMNGDVFIANLRQQGRAPQDVIVIAASRNSEDLAPIIKQGIKDLLFKPFPMNDLLNRIRKLEVERDRKASA